MSGAPTFLRLNAGWDAEPNVPNPVVTRVGSDLLLHFRLNPSHGAFTQDAVGILRFVDCLKCRLGDTNDEGWYKGQCRYSNAAPEWGVFYELTGPDPLLNEPDDWIELHHTTTAVRHFLFYFRDNTFECVATDWRFEPVPNNPLLQRLDSSS